MKNTSKLLASLLATVAVAGGCKTTEDAGTTGDDQNVTAGACRVRSQLTGRDLTSAEIAALGDPVAQLVLRSSSCPETFTELGAHLDRVDDCSADRRGVVTRLVSETSQLLGRPDTYRAVTTRACNGRKPHELVMSTFGIDGASTELPADVELMGLDGATNSFNYYALEKGTWTFFGNSKDFVKEGYTCDDHGTCQANASKRTRCAGCHAGGGLVMKELEFPWLHWSGAVGMPGQEELLGRFRSQLGIAGGGPELEAVITSAGGGPISEGGNAVWGRQRPADLSTFGLAEVLRPVFCTVEVNLLSSSPGASPTIPGDLFFNTKQWGPPTPFATAGYSALLDAFGQSVTESRTGSGAALGKDTVIPFVFPKRSDSDGRQARELLRQGFIDLDFLADVSVVDFTRPIFSKTRCDLLRFAPKLAFDDMTPDNIRAGFLANLAGTSEPEAAAFRASLEDPNDADTVHKPRVEAFARACRARDTAALTKDALAWATHLRDLARGIRAPGGQQIIEFGPAMPFGRPAGGVVPRGWNETTCELE